MPRMISTTTPGIASRPVHLAMIGARTATTAIISNVAVDPSVMPSTSLRECPSRKCPSHQCPSHQCPDHLAPMVCHRQGDGTPSVEPLPLRYDEACSTGLSSALPSRAGVVGFMNLPT